MPPEGIEGCSVAQHCSALLSITEILPRQRPPSLLQSPYDSDAGGPVETGEVGAFPLRRRRVGTGRGRAHLLELFYGLPLSLG